MFIVFVGGGDTSATQNRNSLMNDVNDSFYGGGAFNPQPTPTPTPSATYPMSTQAGREAGIVNQTNDAFSQMEQQASELRRKKLNPNGNYILPEDMNASQKNQWERSFDSNPDWRLNLDNTWSLVPIEPDSEQYKQGKAAMDAATDKVRSKVQRGQGTYNPRDIPMGGGWYDDPSKPIHFDPSRSGDKGLAQIGDILRRLGIT